MVVIPLSPIPSQTLRVVLDGQACDLSLYQRQNHLFADLVTNDIAICTGAICQDRADIVQSPTPHFSGSLHFIDMQGNKSPRYSELGDRYQLVFIPAGEEIPQGLRY